MLCSSGSSQRSLVMRKHWDHQRRHMTLDLIEKSKREIVNHLDEHATSQTDTVQTAKWSFVL